MSLLREAYHYIKWQVASWKWQVKGHYVPIA